MRMFSCCQAGVVTISGRGHLSPSLRMALELSAPLILNYSMTLMLLTSSNGTVVLPPIWVS